MTGGAGFIGSHFIDLLLDSNEYHDLSVVVLDKLTYAGNLENLSGALVSPNCEFIQGDIGDSELIQKILKNVDVVVNFAAETHVDNSIKDSSNFIKTNILGLHTLLDESRKFKVRKFLQISTDEVYGSLISGSWDEENILKPNSPYSASKAAGDLLALSYVSTYGLDITITRCSNNFGPRQHAEKFIPNAIQRLMNGKNISVYGDGENVRDWIHVTEHCKVLLGLIEKGLKGEIYNIGGGNEMTNIVVAKKILKIMNLDESRIDFVEDRAGHDFRYSVDSRKVQELLGFGPTKNFDEELSKTIEWYLEDIRY